MSYYESKADNDRMKSKADNEKPSSKASKSEKDASQSKAEEKTENKAGEKTEKASGSAPLDKDKKENGAKKGAKAAAAMEGVKAGAAAGNVIGHAAVITAKINWLMQAFKAAGAVIQSVIVSVIAISLFGIAAIISVVTSNNVSLRDTNQRDCIVYVDKGAIGDPAHNIDTEVLTQKNQKRIYSTLFYYGLRPEQIFAVLGNWGHESGLDPTSVETVFDEPFRIGYWKQEAVARDFDPRFHGSKIYKDYFEQHPLIQRVGIGLGQWTNERNKRLLRYAEIAGKNLTDEDGRAIKWDEQSSYHWYDLDLQLAFMLDSSSVGDTRASWFRSWADNGRINSDGQVRSDAGSIEFKGDSAPSCKYGEVECIGDNAADSYYDGDLPLDSGAGSSGVTCRENASAKASLKCDSNEAAGKYNIYEDGEYVGIDEDAYKKDFGIYYRYTLYENMVKKYTYEFMTEWEGINDGSYQSRLDAAMKLFYQWYGAEGLDDAENTEPNESNNGSGFFKAEEGYGYSVLAIMDKTKDAELRLWKIYDTDRDMSGCRRISTSSLASSMAETAAMLAWPTAADSRGNNGTKMYQYIHDMVIPGDTIYQSCDRTVCTIVRWSGYDDNFPKGATSQIIQYLVTSPRWTELDWGGDKSQLMPGDILIKKDSMAGGSNDESPGDAHHVLMYIGEHAASTFYDVGKDDDELTGAPLSGSCIVHGSFGERSPAIDVWHDYSDYHAFRCTYPMEPGRSKYVGFTWSSE